MKTAKQWLDEYSVTHQNPVNKKIHMICVPAILFSVIGALWYLRVPSSTGPWWLNGAVVATIFALGFYARMGVHAFAVMLATLVVMFAGVIGIEAAGLPGLPIYFAIFVFAWIGQFYGHHIEGKKPSFFKDLQFLLIGPLWFSTQGLARKNKK